MMVRAEDVEFNAARAKCDGCGVGVLTMPTPPGMNFVRSLRLCPTCRRAPYWQERLNRPADARYPAGS